MDEYDRQLLMIESYIDEERRERASGTWRTREGHRLKPEEMSAAHLANTVAFLRDPERRPRGADPHPWISTAIVELRRRLATRAGVARAVTEGCGDLARARLREIASEVGCPHLDLIDSMIALDDAGRWRTRVGERLVELIEDAPRVPWDADGCEVRIEIGEDGGIRVVVETRGDER